MPPDFFVGIEYKQTQGSKLKCSIDDYISLMSV